MKEYIVRIEHGADGAVHYFRTGGEIVRCDKCRWHYEHGRDIVCAISKDVVRSDDYCSYGVMRTDVD